MPGESYAKAGVDLLKVREIQRSLSGLFGSTFANRAGKLGRPLIPIGHYGGLIDIGGGNALSLHTDGVGSKVLIAQELGRFDTIGIDCVAMTVNDLVCLGSEPLALLDYIALEREDDDLVSELCKGLADGARTAAVAIVGGETAIMKDVIRGRKGRGFDLVSMGVGIVKSGCLIDGSSIETGDTLLGVESSGLHSNGYTLARKVFSGSLRKKVDALGSSVGESLLTPTSIYVKPTLESIRKADVHGIAHITGGSFSKLVRLAGQRSIAFELTLPEPPAIFRLLKTKGRISDFEMYRTFNMGVGLCLCVPSSDEKKVVRIFRSHGFESHHLGSVVRGKGVRVNGLVVS